VNLEEVMSKRKKKISLPPGVVESHDLRHTLEKARLLFNPRSNTLEQESYVFPLKDTPEPILFRDTFPYDEVPKIGFNHRRVPMWPPEEIWVTDTTFRDGQQARPPFTVKQTVDLYEMMHRLGGKAGLIRQCEFFLYSERDREAVEKCLSKGYKYPEITGWIRAKPEDFKLVKKMGLKETGILTSASDYHIFLKLKKTRREAAESYLRIVEAALEMGIRPRCHLEDITRADFYGFVVPFVQELMDLSRQSGIPVKIRACDTMGFGVPYPGAGLPRSVPGIVYGLRHHADVPAEQLEWHGHNDFHKALVNAATAWLYGCSAANGTLLGFGERTGNPPLEGLIIECLGFRGDTSKVDTTVITEIVEYLKKDCGFEIPQCQPFVGQNFNVTRAGIHADGVLKDEEIYNIFDTAKLLKRPPQVTVSATSGTAGVAHWVNSHLGLKGDEALSKRSGGVLKIAQWVRDEYARGRATDISTEELVEQGKLHLPDHFGQAPTE